MYKFLKGSTYLKVIYSMFTNVLHNIPILPYKDLISGYARIRFAMSRKVKSNFNASLHSYRQCLSISIESYRGEILKGYRGISRVVGRWLDRGIAVINRIDVLNELYKITEARQGRVRGLKNLGIPVFIYKLPCPYNAAKMPLFLDISHMHRCEVII